MNLKLHDTILKSSKINNNVYIKKKTPSDRKTYIYYNFLHLTFRMRKLIIVD